MIVQNDLESSYNIPESEEEALREEVGVGSQGLLQPSSELDQQRAPDARKYETAGGGTPISPEEAYSKNWDCLLYTSDAADE